MSKKTACDGKQAEERMDVPERWSAQRKAEVVLRLLPGEAIDEV